MSCMHHVPRNTKVCAGGTFPVRRLQRWGQKRGMQPRTSPKASLFMVFPLYVWVEDSKDSLTAELGVNTLKMSHTARCASGVEFVVIVRMPAPTPAFGR